MASKKTATTRKTPTKTRKKASTKKQPVLRSFRSYHDDTPFLTLKFTRQSLYWLILSLVILTMGLWVLYLNIKIQDIYNRIDMNNAYMSDVEMKALYPKQKTAKE